MLLFLFLPEEQADAGHDPLPEFEKSIKMQKKI